jgi:N-glycosidase YbiA
MTIEFYSTTGEYGCFSNFSRHPFKLKGRTWRTSEHYFQSQKFAGTSFENKVAKCDRPMEAATMGRDRKLPLRKDWEGVKDNVMREAVYAKFSQNPHIAKVLLGTYDEKLVEHTDKDNYWADGGNGKGKNMLGIILMEVRDRLKKEGFKC